MTSFALNVVTAVPSDSTGGSVWDVFSPLSKLITIACVNNKAQFEKTDNAAVVRFVCTTLLLFFKSILSSSPFAVIRCPLLHLSLHWQK
jgi:hypothetical protein